MEKWKDIPRYKGFYEASDLGRIRNKKTFNIIIGCKDKDGYLITTLRKNGIVKCEKIHRLIAESFLINKNNYKTINHKNEIKTDNRVVNLEWCTQEYNNSYSKSKLLGQYNKDLILIKKWKNANVAGKCLNISPSNIRNCCRGNANRTGGYIWKYI